MIISAQWANADQSIIWATCDNGDVMNLPPSDANRHYNEILAAGMEIAPYVAPAPMVPDNVTNYQARKALIDAGLFDAINAALMALPASDPARNAWEYANNFFRQSDFITSLAGGFGLSSEQIDALFVQASAVQ